MKFLRNILSKQKPSFIEIAGLGNLEFYEDKQDKYWKTEKPVLNLPPKFDFGTISGDVNEVAPEALLCFRKIAANPIELFKLLPDSFFSKAHSHFENLNANNVEDEFYIKSLTITSKTNYEFGLHSKSKDVFIEVFVRDGKPSEVYLDTGCCDV